jgi:hypothetical protein
MWCLMAGLLAYFGLVSGALVDGRRTLPTSHREFSRSAGRHVLPRMGWGVLRRSVPVHCRGPHGTQSWDRQADILRVGGRRYSVLLLALKVYLFEGGVFDQTNASFLERCWNSFPRFAFSGLVAGAVYYFVRGVPWAQGVFGRASRPDRFGGGEGASRVATGRKVPIGGSADTAVADAPKEWGG